MSTVLPKKQMSEEDIKLQYITPAITSKWDIKKNNHGNTGNRWSYQSKRKFCFS